jgi:hypothetical protein
VHAEEAERRERGGPHRGRVLADPRRERDDVHAAQLGDVGPQVRSQPVDVHVEGERRRLVSGQAPLVDVAHVGDPGQPEHPAALVEERVELARAHLLSPREHEQHGRVDVARPRAHDQTLQRREAHRGLHRLSAVDRGDRRAVAEMEHDLLQLAERTADELGRGAADVHVARAVEAVPADAVLPRHLAIDRIRVRGGRQRLVECGVEHRDVRQVGERGPRRADALHGTGVVQRREHRQLVDVDLDQVVDQGRLEEPRTPLHDPMADRDRRTLRQGGAVLGERVEHHGEARRVVGDRQLARPLRIRHAVDRPARGGHQARTGP